jgi:hypothetical protein
LIDIKEHAQLGPNVGWQVETGLYPFVNLRRHPVLHRVRLELARSHDFPDGSARHGYEITAPLDASGLLDPHEWNSKRAKCRVRRFWAGEPDRHGRLVHRAGGAGGATWLIDYDQDTTDDDEAGYRLGAHRFQAGEYVSIRDEDGELHTFKVAQVKAIEAADGIPGA